jgi:hypothetical protein
VIAAEPATGWYVYAFAAPANAELRDALAAMTGVGSEPLTAVGGDDLAAVVGPVPLAEFGEATLPERLNDRDWLEAKARAHEAVLERLLELTTIVPLRFGAIFEDTAAIESMVEQRRDELTGTLERVRGCVELGVQVWQETRRAGDDAPAASGRAYLERRQEARRSAEEWAVRVQELLGAAHDRLLADAEGGVVNRPQPRELTGRDETMLLNAAYLVPAGDQALARTVAELDAEHRELGLRFELTGPWPPHNFVGEET